MTIYFGCAVWAYKGWAGDLYPARVQPHELLARYVERLTAVEGNTTFYAVPDDATIARWAEQMPATFRFCPKLPQTISHHGAIAPHIDAALAFLRSMEPLGERLGPVMLQLPPDFGPGYLDDLDRFITHVAPACPARLAVEVRHPGWWHGHPADRLAELLDRAGAIRTLLDTRPIYDGPHADAIAQERRKPQVPITPILHHQTALIRYIGHPEPSCNDPFLDQWAERVDGWLDQGATVYFFAHCPVEERSPGYAKKMHRLLTARRPALPPLPWDLVPPEPQLSLF
jgi:uncharacterized protein YecE (DUF72 family)